MRKTCCVLIVVLGLIGGCATAWKMDYGKPSAQFLGKDVHTMGTSFIDKKVTVKGTVTGHEFTDAGHRILILDETIRCVTRGAGPGAGITDKYAVGNTVSMDGFLRVCEPDSAVLKPAMGRDPYAPFEPEK